MQSITQKKIFISAFGSIASIFVIVGIFQIKDHLLPQKKVKKGPASVEFSLADLPNVKDTDSDGLSDLDEQVTYRTSMYIADTDSDGIVDGVEVQQGTDPTCPQGKTCGKGDFGFGEQKTADAITFGNVQIKKPEEIAGAPLVTPAQMRELLIKAGGEKAMIEKISDEKLKELYEKTLMSSPELLAQKKVVDILTLQDMKAVRQALKDGGMPAAQIDAISDEELKKLLQEAIGKTKQ